MTLGIYADSVKSKLSSSLSLLSSSLLLLSLLSPSSSSLSANRLIAFGNQIASRFSQTKKRICFYLSFLVLSLFNLCVVLLAIKHYQSAREFCILKKKGTLFSLHDRNEGWRIFSRTRILRRSQNTGKRKKNTGRLGPLVLRGHKHFMFMNILSR